MHSNISGGAAYVLGRMNGECWYLYTLDKPGAVQEPDQTLEISFERLKINCDMITGNEAHVEDFQDKSYGTQHFVFVCIFLCNILSVHSK